MMCGGGHQAKPLASMLSSIALLSPDLFQTGATQDWMLHCEKLSHQQSHSGLPVTSVLGVLQVITPVQQAHLDLLAHPGSLNIVALLHQSSACQPRASPCGA